MYEESLRIRRNVLGNEHPDVAQSLNNLALLLKTKVRVKRAQEPESTYSQGKYDEAKPMYEESLHIRRKILGDEHQDVALSLNNIAALLQAQVRPAGFCCSAQ